MKIVICDITGRTFNYDWALYSALLKKKEKNDAIQLWSPLCVESEESFNHFFSLVPIKFRNSSNIFFRLLKVFDTLCAYIIICVRFLIAKPDVFHLQWFPFISLGKQGASLDLIYFRFLRMISPHTKFVFTIHNICPHGMKEDDRRNYNPVFSKALSIFDHYIVHTERTKNDVCDDLNINSNKVSVVYHGVFTPKNVQFSPSALQKGTINLIMYGNQNWYKGTDIFVKSLCYLEESIKNYLHVTICGAISKDYLRELQSIETGINIAWIPRFIEDELLYNQINESDIIVLPYRRISQSGVLLLALATNRFIITSDLPTFKETLKGFQDDLFFKTENPKDLARVIGLYANNEVDTNIVHKNIKKLQNLYSWSQSAKETLIIYKKLVKC